jgi:hypothetical protein
MIPPINNNAEPSGDVTIGTPTITVPPDPNKPEPQIAPQFGSIFKRSARRH